ncbi:CapA family protein [Egbenema bharatensis]|uniref:CapA family protein n=1 Tax=Egbenema bharatensis TaxID=3463334 RepID=UPI003A8B374F
MASMDQSWESSVVQLAQAGNLRAIAFWVNRYLVPQGICAQVSFEQPGHLLVRVVSHTKPDCDRLVQFILARLNSLKAPSLQSARIRAQLVGASELLWEKKVQLASVHPAGEAVSRPVSHPVSRPVSHPGTGSTDQAVAPNPSRTPTSAHPFSHSTQVGSSVSVAANSIPSFVQSVRDFQFPTQTSSSQPSVAQSATASRPIAPPAAQPKKRVKRRKLPQKQSSLFQPSLLQPSLLHSSDRLKRWSRSVVWQITQMPGAAQRWSAQSTQWFNRQTVPVRALTLSGSAVAVFFLGCGVELLRHYITNPSVGYSASRVGGTRSNRSNSTKITTALENVPVIYPTVKNPDDPAVTLVFSNSAALGQTTRRQRNEAQLSSRRVAQGITAYQQADIVMTSLDHPLTLPQIHSGSGEASSTRTVPETTREFQSSLPMPEQTLDLGDRTSGDWGEEAAFSSQRPQVTVQELLDNGVNVVNLADNLPVQSNTSGQVQTLDVLKQSQIHAVGAGSTPQEARRPQVLEVKGHRIAYLAYSEQSLATQLAVAANVVPPLPTQIAEDIQAIREQVDWVMVSFRWQRNLRAYPASWQTHLSRLAIDHGADLVVGYHAQMTQGAEIYNGRVIAYSLGSSIEEYLDYYGDEPIPNRDTVTLKVTLDDHDMGIEFLPVQLRQGQASIAEGEEGAAILEYFHQASSLFDQPLRSPVVLDSRVRFSLPTAPDAELPTDPFLSYPQEN